MYAPASFMCVKFKTRYACYLLHTDLLCALVQLNTSGTLDIHHISKFVTSTHSGTCQTHAMHHSNTVSCYKCIFYHEMHMVLQNVLHECSVLEQQLV